MSVAKHHADVLTALRDALLGIPWMPPIPGTAQHPEARMVVAASRR